MKFSQIFFLPLALLLSCIQFKVDNLTPDLVTKIQIGSSPTHIQGELVNNVLTNLPLSIPFHSGLAYIVDTKHGLLKGYDAQGNLDWVVGTTEETFPTTTDIYKYKFGNIGMIAIDSGDNLYIHNRFGTKEGLDSSKDQENLYKKFSGQFEVTSSSALPGYILKMNQKAVVKSIIGASGKNTEPFRFIESLRAGSSDTLFVYHKASEEMRLSYFKEEELRGEIRESLLDIFTSEDTKTYLLKLDSMIPHMGGNYALVSVGFYTKNDNRFKFRRIFRVNFSSPKTTQLVKEIQDPSEILFHIHENNEFYVWETEDKGNSVRFQVHDQEGNHVNNIRLAFDAPRGQWRETFTDSKDNIYTIRIRAGFLELYRWR